MKKRWKKIVVLIVVLLLITSLGIKIYFETDNATFENRIENMNNETKSLITCSVEHKTLKQAEYEIHYFVSGKKDSALILFLHPAFSDHRAFDQQIDFFASKYRVITIDLIGHGLSKANKSKDKIDVSVEHIDKILKTEGYDKVHLVGVSMGSLIAQYYALHYPEKVQSLTALGGYDINIEDKEVAKVQRSSNMGLIFRAVFSMQSFRKKTAEITCFSEKGQYLFYETESLYERKSFMVMSGLQNIIKNRTGIHPEYPTLILTGEHDIELAKVMAKKWHSVNAKSQFYTIKNAGHCANIDEPSEFNSVLDTFIEKRIP